MVKSRSFSLFVTCTLLVGAFSQNVQKVSNVSLNPSVVDNTGGVSVSWNPISGINVTYTVCYSTVNGQTSNPPPNGAVCVNTTAASEDIGSLLPDRMYYVWVRAEVGGAVGPYSDRRSTTTYDVPDVISTVNLERDIRGGRPGVHVSWEEPQSILPILKYVVNHAESSTGFGRLDFLSPTPNYFYVSELDPGTSYNFLVSASSAAGSSHFSSPQSLTTHDVPPAPSTPMVFSEFLNEKPALRVIWTQPQSELLTQYTVQYRMVNSTVWTTLHTPTTAVFIEGLLGGTSYQVRVRAVSEIGNGSFTPIVTARTVGEFQPNPTTSAPVPSQTPVVPSIQFDGDPIAMRTVSVSWSPVDSIAGATYTVWYSTGVDPDNPSTPPLQAQVLRGIDATSVSLTLVEDSSTLYIWVAAVAPDGTVGPYSERVTWEQVVTTQEPQVQSDSGLVGGLVVVAVLAVVFLVLLTLVVVVVLVRGFRLYRMGKAAGENTYDTVQLPACKFELESEPEVMMSVSPAYHSSDNFDLCD